MPATVIGPRKTHEQILPHRVRIQTDHDVRPVVAQPEHRRSAAEDFCDSCGESCRYPCNVDTALVIASRRERAVVELKRPKSTETPHPRPSASQAMPKSHPTPDNGPETSAKITSDRNREAECQRVLPETRATNFENQRVSRPERWRACVRRDVDNSRRALGHRRIVSRDRTQYHPRGLSRSRTAEQSLIRTG